MNFQTFGLQQPLLHALEKMKFIVPTPIQEQAIPPALEGKDVLGNAQTGTGKTGAFGIPLVNWLLNSKEGTALVLAPTRELAIQVLDTLHLMIGKETGIRTALLIGGDPITGQFKRLRNKPRLIVATPGRLNDHIERKTVALQNTGFLVLDEIDRMLDMGFDVQLEQIMKCLPKQRQTLMFSATLPQNIIKLSNKYLTDPVRISVGSTHEPLHKIKQEVIQISESNKYDQLLVQLNQREGSIIIFVKTKMGAEKLAEKLEQENHDADAIHGDLRQTKRERVINAFRKRKYRIMVATDVAARGLDIPHIEHVINYDMPQCPEDYIHRIGRTARAGAEGSALSFVTKADGAKWRAIERLLNHGESTERSRPAGKGFTRERKSNDSVHVKRSASKRDGSRDHARSEEWAPRDKSRRHTWREKDSEWTPRSAGNREKKTNTADARGGNSERTPLRAGSREDTREWTPRGTGKREDTREWAPRGTGKREGVREWAPRGTGKREGAREWSHRGSKTTSRDNNTPRATKTVAHGGKSAVAQTRQSSRRRGDN